LTRILAVADEVDEGLYGDKLMRLQPDVVLSCGDLPTEYLEYIVSRLNVPLLYVPGNHDPDFRPVDETWTPLRAEPMGMGPGGCINVDGRVEDAAGLRIAGLGGSMRYRPGPNQYTNAQMRWRALRLEMVARLRRGRSGRRLDVLLTHAPPEGFGSKEGDLAHRGFGAFNRLIKNLAPRLLLHGHVHPYGVAQPPRRVGATLIINAVPSRMIEI
jgi:calcineurin-like phosphoesterase family protein